MSAITLFSPNDILILPRVCGAGFRQAPDEHLLYSRQPVVSPRWSVEVDAQGKRRLVERWFKNE
jgi:hypothetical protein